MWATQYVKHVQASSRVSSLKGLHLINFDPINIKSRVSAIKEYNRLKVKFRPESDEIPLKHNKNIHLKDIIWKNASNVHNVQTESVVTQNKTIQFKRRFLLRKRRSASDFQLYSHNRYLLE